MPIIVEPVGPVPLEGIDLPDFAFPFTFDSKGEAVVNQQGTVEEVAACVANIATCPQGFRTDVPDFGIPDPTFSPLPLNTTLIARAITKHEPRARLNVVTSTDDPARPQNQTVTVYVEIDQNT